MKQVQVGPVQLSVGVSAGVVSVSASVGGSLGGGEAAGVVQGNLSAGLQMSLQQSADLGLALLAEAFPSLSAEIAVVKAAADSELAKVSV